jgi:hypothetical protein
MIECELFCASNKDHLQQIYTGFAMLSERGAIRLKQRILSPAPSRKDLPPPLHDVALAHLLARVNGKNVAFDVHDSNFIDEVLLSQVDFYFKRSWQESAVKMCSAPHKVLPLGANVWVHHRAPDKHAMQRAFVHSGVDALKSVLRALGLDRLMGDALYTPRVPDLEAPAAVATAPRVLFLAEAWDPATALCEKTAQERLAINETRAMCMRGLKEAFGPKVTCGFRPAAFSRQAFPELVIDDVRLTKKRSYLALVREHAICVSSSGLHQSIGWKFAEYLSMSRAIVAERLHMGLPGGMAADVNYLEFTSAAQCVAQVSRLVHQPELMASLMRANRDYYTSFLEPSALVHRALHKVIA